MLPSGLTHSLPGPSASTDTWPMLGVVARSTTGVVPAVAAALGDGGEPASGAAAIESGLR
jgi:hypothetical protein